MTLKSASQRLFLIVSFTRRFLINMSAVSVKRNIIYRMGSVLLERFKGAKSTPIKRIALFAKSLKVMLLLE